MSHQVFITYAAQDAGAASQIGGALTTADVECVLAPRENGAIGEAESGVTALIHGSRLLLIVHSTTAESSFSVIRETGLARSGGLAMIDVRLESLSGSNSLIEPGDRLTVLETFPTPIAEHLDQIVRTVKSRLAAAAPTAPQGGTSVVNALWGNPQSGSGLPGTSAPDPTSLAVTVPSAGSPPAMAPLPPAQTPPDPAGAAMPDGPQEFATVEYHGPPMMEPLPATATPSDSSRAALPPLSRLSDGVDELRQTGSIDAPPRPGLIGRLNHYELIRKLGEGGMGVVLLARDTRTDTMVAIKTIRPKYAAVSNAQHRFVVEARHMQRMNHPNVLKVLEVCDRPEGSYYVMPFIPTGSLAGQMHPDKPLQSDVILRIARNVAEALRYAHDEAGVIHRDIKPQNVLIDPGGNALLSDFGLIRTVFNDTVTDDQQRSWTVGTGPYMPPEIVAGKAGDTRADVYSFGAMLFEMACGQPPYLGSSTEEVLTKIKLGPPAPVSEVNPGFPPGFAKVIEGAMGRELRDRYAHMADVLEDLRRVQIGQEPLEPHGVPQRTGAAATAAAPAAPVSNPAPPPRSYRMAAGVTLVAAAAVVVFGMMNHWKLPGAQADSSASASATQPTAPGLSSVPGGPVAMESTTPGASGHGSAPTSPTTPSNPPSVDPKNSVTTPGQVIQPPHSALLEQSIESNDTAVFNTLIKSGKIDVNQPLPNQDMPLSFAIDHERQKLAVALIKAGAKLDLVSSTGETLLYTAARHNQVEVIKALCAAHLDADSSNDVTGRTALYAAIYFDQPEAAQALLSLGADPDRSSRIGQETPRSVANSKGSSRIKMIVNTAPAPAR